jgi:pimeloyl-ACP methyl ester carboxylesterase
MAAQERKLRVWQDKLETQVDVRGNGPPLVFLHGPWGLRNEGGFLDRLAQSHTVYAPKFPGTSDGDPEAIHRLDDWLDLITYHAELFDRLELAAPTLVGHSFGGMVAAELAAALPGRVQRLVLIDPVGLWRDDMPVKNWMTMSEEQRRLAFFAAPKGDVANRFFGLDGVEAQVGFIWSQACTGKFVWPIPDKGLKKRIHRIAAPSLIVWGKADGIVAPAYAQEFRQRIAKARIEIIDQAGHLPHLEQTESVARLIRSFLVE